MYVRMYQTLSARFLSTYIRTIHGLRPPTTTRLDLSSLFVSSLAQLRLTERTLRFPPTLDGRKSTDREPRQGNLLGKTSSSTQPWTRFPSTTLPPLCYFSLFLAHSFSLPLPPPLPPFPSPPLPIRCSFYRLRLLSVSFSLFVSSLYLVRTLSHDVDSPSFAYFVFRLVPPRSPCAGGICLPLLLAALLRRDFIYSNLCFFPSFCPFATAPHRSRPVPFLSSVLLQHRVS